MMMCTMCDPQDVVVRNYLPDLQPTGKMVDPMDSRGCVHSLHKKGYTSEAFSAGSEESVQSLSG